MKEKNEKPVLTQKRLHTRQHLPHDKAKAVYVCLLVVLLMIGDLEWKGKGRGRSCVSVARDLTPADHMEQVLYK